jgi:hypothetical protein
VPGIFKRGLSVKIPDHFNAIWRQEGPPDGNLTFCVVLAVDVGAAEDLADTGRRIHPNLLGKELVKPMGVLGDGIAK